MALYEIQEKDAAEAIKLLNGIILQGNRQERKAIDEKIDRIIEALSKPHDIINEKSK